MTPRSGLAILSLISAVFLTISAGPADAFEAYVTQCPNHFPGQANVDLLNGVFRESPTAPAPNFTFNFTDAHGYVHYMSHTYHDEELREAFLVCRYKNGKDVRVPIKGRLYNCGTIFQRDSHLTGAGLRTVTVWCASITP